MIQTPPMLSFGYLLVADTLAARLFFSTHLRAALLMDCDDSGGHLMRWPVAYARSKTGVYFPSGITRPTGLSSVKLISSTFFRTSGLRGFAVLVMRWLVHGLIALENWVCMVVKNHLGGWLVG